MNNFFSWQASGIFFPRYRTFAFFVAAIFMILFTEKVDIQWKWAHLFFDYQYGFLKRGLIGEIYRWLPLAPSLDNFKVISALLLGSVAILYHHLIREMPNREYFGLAILFLCSPLLFRNYIHDWGRYDQLAILFVFLQIYFVGDKVRSERLLWLSPLLLFIHEATAVWAFPTILTIAWFEHRSLLYKLLPVLVACGVAILLWGGLDIDPWLYHERLREWAHPEFVHWTLVLTVTSQMTDVISQYFPYFWQNFNSPQGHQAILFFALSVVPIFMIKDKRLMVLNLLALASTCILFVVAADHWRWVSLLGTSALFSVLYAYKKNLIHAPVVVSSYLMIIGLMGMVFDPIGIFPEVFLEINLTPNF